MRYLVLSRVRSVVTEINRNGNSLLRYVTLMAVVAFLVSLMLHRKGRGCAFNYAPTARWYSR